MRKQLRPFYTPEEYAEVYSETYDHTVWTDHIERVAKTVEVLDQFAQRVDARTIADLSCGDGAIVHGSRHRWEQKILGDYTSTGPIEEAILRTPFVDMFVLSETLEHIEDPDSLLRQIRDTAQHMVLTTPHGETNNYNPQHYWGWDNHGIRKMLGEADWLDVNCELFTPQSNDYYTFQIWTCS